MKKLIGFILLLTTVQSFAQQENRNVVRPGRTLSRSLISVEYNSWFERLVVTDATFNEQISQALYYGFGFNFEHNWYRATWGLGIGAGVAAGSAVGGDKSGTLTYFEPRVPWYSARLMPRLFWRWNQQIDFGLAVGMFYKKSEWPDQEGALVVKSGSDLISGLFVDMRVRLSPRLELIQSFGQIYKDSSIYWRLGLAYLL